MGYNRRVWGGGPTRAGRGRTQGVRRTGNVAVQGGGQVCQGTMSTGMNLDGENFAASGNPETCCYFLMVPLISWWALSKSWATQHSNAFQSHNHCMLKKKNIFVLSLRLVHWCTFLNSHLHFENFAAGVISPRFLTAKISREILPSRKISLPCNNKWRYTKGDRGTKSELRDATTGGGGG